MGSRAPDPQTAQTLFDAAFETLLKRAANENDKHAQRLLAKLYYNGSIPYGSNRVPRDEQESQKWYQRSRSSGQNNSEVVWVSDSLAKLSVSSPIGSQLNQTLVDMENAADKWRSYSAQEQVATRAVMYSKKDTTYAAGLAADSASRAASYKATLLSLTEKFVNAWNQQNAEYKKQFSSPSSGVTLVPNLGEHQEYSILVTLDNNSHDVSAIQTSDGSSRARTFPLYVKR